MTSTGDALAPRYDVVMFSFSGIDTAAKVLSRIKDEGKLDECEIEGEVLITRAPPGTVPFRAHGAAGVGAGFGAAAGSLVGMSAGPVGIVLLLIAGGLVGGVTGYFAGRAFDREDLRKVAEAVPPGSSAYLAVVDAGHADGLTDAFAAEGAAVLNIPVETELASALREAITHRVTRG